MKTIHELKIQGRCPINDGLDVYDLIVETTVIIKVEDILSAVTELPQPIFQEDITQRLAHKLRASITTIGFHSGVKTTCSA
jgi:hypothetical protein